MKKILKRILQTIGLLGIVQKLVGKFRNEKKRHRKSLAIQHKRRTQFFAQPNNIAKSSEGDIITTLKLLRVKDLGIPLMRLGGDADGGYVVPENLSQIKFCFSPGVAENADFELSLSKFGIRSYLADASVEKSPVESEFLDFEKKFIGSSDDPQWVTLSDWIAMKAPNSSNLLLQMDIEGGEWQVFSMTKNETLKKFAIIVVEFHDLHMIETLIGRTTINSVLEKLNKNFELCFLSPNNAELPIRFGKIVMPTLLEATYVRKDFIKSIKQSQKVGQKFDFPHVWSVGKNVPWIDDLYLDSFFKEELLTREK